MLCEKCKKRTATVFYNENLNGKLRSYSLCGECAAKLREKGDLQDITAMLGSFADPFSDLRDDFFGGFFGMPIQKAIPNTHKCPTCGYTYADIMREGRVGCADCYRIFSAELTRTVQAIHGSGVHVGMVPSRHRARKEREEQLKKLRRSMQDAIQKEDFERAASLRDDIKKMEGEQLGKEGE